MKYDTVFGLQTLYPSKYFETLVYCFSVSKAKVQDLYRLENMRRFALAIALQVQRREHRPTDGPLVYDL